MIKTTVNKHLETKVCMYIEDLYIQKKQINLQTDTHHILK
jgi:hypothetical protein